MGMQNNIPELRFPNFDGEWERKKLVGVANVTTGGTPSTLKKEYWNGTIRWMNSGELNLKRVYEVENRITEKGLKNSSTKLIPKFSILIGLAGQGKTRGTVAMNMIELCTNQSIATIYPDENSFHSDFLYHNLDNRYDELRSLSTGDGGRGGLNLQIIKSILLDLPSIAEQRKIASFFTAIDQKITQLKLKKTLLEHYKKGMMQGIFSQEIKFKDKNGREFPKWEKKNIKDLAEIKYGKDQKQISCEDGKYPILGTGGEIGRTNDFLTDKPSVLIGRKGTIDKPRYMDTPFWTVDTLFYTNVFTNTNPKWLYYKFGTINWYLYNEASGVPSLSSSTIYMIPISLPTLPEQIKIANFLSAIDYKINQTQIQIENAEVWKRGLVQQMFVKNIQNHVPHQ